MRKDPYTDPDMVRGIYEDPANEVLLAEYAFETYGIQLGLRGAGPLSAIPVPEIDILDIQGQSPPSPIIPGEIPGEEPQV